MKNQLLRALARLASKPYQEIYVVRGTKDEYVLPEDLVEDVASLSQLAMRAENQSAFTQEQIGALGEMASTIKTSGPEIFAAMSVSASLPIYQNPNWILLRARAGACLSLFGVDVHGLAPEEIDQLDQSN